MWFSVAETDLIHLSNDKDGSILMSAGDDAVVNSQGD